MASCRRRRILAAAKGPESEPATEEEEITPATMSASSPAHYLWPLSIFAASNVLECSDYYWNAGCFSPASISIHLGAHPVYVTRVALEAVMVPAMGKVRHEIRTGLTADEMQTACWHTGVAIDGEWLHVHLANSAGDLRRRSCFLEVRTHESPSWVAWRRIRVWKATV